MKTTEAGRRPLGLEFVGMLLLLLAVLALLFHDLIGLVDSLDYWNPVIGQTNQQIRILERFDLVPKPGPTNTAGLDYWTAVPSATSAFALFDYAGALPRALRFSPWQVQTNDQTALTQLFRPDFDPHQCVLVSGGLPAGTPPPAPRPDAGSVDFTSYSPRDIVLKSRAPAASVLLLNDHYDPDWKVLVDGRTAPLLRCNFIMRDVALAAGDHTIEFRYEPPFGLRYVSLAAMGVSVVVLIVVVIDRSYSPAVAVASPIIAPKESVCKVPVNLIRKPALAPLPRRPRRAALRPVTRE